MQINEKSLDSLNLTENTMTVLSGHLARFPSLIIDRCLTGAHVDVVRDIRAGCGSDRPIAAETITMPRKFGSGPRPSTISATGTRSLYRALVSDVEESLPLSSRSDENSERYQQFPSRLEEKYAVYLDIAACYEYIDHTNLHDEILIRSFNVPTCHGIVTLLGEIMGRPRGLPQMHWASDRLADAYLERIVRKLAMSGHESVRYVDDIRVPASSWDTALDIVELAAGAARDLGLTLSGEKTKIYKRETLLDQIQIDADVLNQYFAAANLIRAFSNQAFTASYGAIDDSVDETEDGGGASDPLLLPTAMWELKKDWFLMAKKDGGSDYLDRLSALQKWMPLAVGSLAIHDERIEDEVLSHWTFSDPSSIRSVCTYLIRRVEGFSQAIFEDNWATIHSIILQSRRSPWSKIWILHTITRVAPFSYSSESEDIVRRWTLQQLLDGHELVRAEAAWAAATLKELEPTTLGSLYGQATPLTQHALAAAMQLQGTSGNSIFKAICDDGPLNRKAIEWAENLPGSGSLSLAESATEA